MGNKTTEARYEDEWLDLTVAYIREDRFHAAWDHMSHLAWRSPQLMTARGIAVTLELTRGAEEAAASGVPCEGILLAAKFAKYLGVKTS